MSRAAAVGIVILVAAVAAALIVGVLALVKVNDRADSAAALAAQIQQERSENIRRACEDTNARYDKTVRELDRLLRLRGASPERRRRIETSRASTVVLIAALVPKRDCDRVVAQQVKKNP